MNIKPKARTWSLAPVAAGMLLWGTWYFLEEWPWNEEFNRLPAQAIFHDVTGKDVPPGVSDLKVAARSYLIKRWVWMRFQATDEAIASLDVQVAYDEEPEQVRREATERALKGTGWAASTKYNEQDMTSVGWPEVASIARPEVYQVSSHQGSFIWIGDMIVDRPKHLVYIHAGGD